MSSRNKIVYHYCDLNAFISILTKANIWWSDLLMSNDKDELLCFRDAVNQRIREKMIKVNKDALYCWDKVVNICRDSIFRDSYCLGICLSKQRDLLSQWICYADDGKGVAIGFDVELLKKIHKDIGNYYNSFCGDVVYTGRKKEKIIDKIVEDNFVKMRSKSALHAALELDQNYNNVFPKIKQEDFAPECEWRITSMFGREQLRPREFGKCAFSELKYRVRDGKAVAYVEMNFSDLKNELIKEIVIGPKCKMEKNDIDKMLFINGYDWPRIQSEKSKITYA